MLLVEYRQRTGLQCLFSILSFNMLYERSQFWQYLRLLWVVEVKTVIQNAET